MARAWIGTSGYNYPHWRGDFYPARLPGTRWLPFYADHFDVVEINYSFYQLPAVTTFRNWAEQTPKGFRFVVKGSRFITHIKRLRDARPHIQKLMDASRPIWDRLAAVLWQLPPRERVKLERLGPFLDATEAVDGPKGLRHAFEFRDPSWFVPDVYDALRSHDAALVFADGAFDVIAKGQPHNDEKPTIVAPQTASWAYVRRHGDARHAGNYDAHEVKADARWIRRRLAQDHDVFTFYNNDVGGWAPKNAKTLLSEVERLGTTQAARPAAREVDPSWAKVRHRFL